MAIQSGRLLASYTISYAAFSISNTASARRNAVSFAGVNRAPIVTAR